MSIPGWSTTLTLASAPTLHSTMDAHTFGMRSNAHSNSSNAYANGVNQVRAPAGPGRRAAAALARSC